MMSSMSLGKSEGDIVNPTADLNDPNDTFRRGLILNDVPFSLKLFGQYQLPYSIGLSGTVQHFTGFPETTSVLVNAARVVLTRPTQTITVEPRGTTRLPSVNMVDLSLRKSFTAGGRYAIEPVLDVFNVANGSAIRARSAQLGPTYDAASDVQRGRMVKLGLNVRF